MVKPCSTSYWRYWLLGPWGIIFRKLKLGFHGFKEQMQIPGDSFLRLSLKAALLKRTAANLTTDPVASLDRVLSNQGDDI